MNRFEEHFYKYIRKYRLAVQLSAILFIALIPLFNLLGYRQIIGTYYSITIGNLDIVDPALLIQNLLLTHKLYLPMVLGGIIPLLIALYFGKIFCSWVCPFNLLAEISDNLKKRIRPVSVKSHFHNPKSQIYWFVYGAFLLILAISGIPVITHLSMPGLISAQTADLIFAGSLGIELILVPGILVIEVFYRSRFWCRTVCPVGATLAIPKFKNTMSVEFEPHKCHFQCSPELKEPLCNAACPLQLNPKQKGIYPYCINCGACIEACNKSGGSALYFTFHPKK